MVYTVPDEYKKFSGIYLISSPLDERIYVGSAKELYKRYHEHYRKIKVGKHHNILLQRFFDKYGPDSLIYSLIETCDKTDLIEREQYWINSYNCVNNGFNLSPTAGSSIGVKRSKEHIEVMRKNSTGVKQSPETIEKRVASLRGQKRTKEQIAKITTAWRVSASKNFKQVEHACEICGKTFKALPQRKFCSRDCANTRPMNVSEKMILAGKAMIANARKHVTTDTFNKQRKAKQEKGLIETVTVQFIDQDNNLLGTFKNYSDCAKFFYKNYIESNKVELSCIPKYDLVYRNIFRACSNGYKSYGFWFKKAKNSS